MIKVELLATEAWPIGETTMRFITSTKRASSRPRQTAFATHNVFPNERIGLWYLLVGIALLLLLASASRA